MRRRGWRRPGVVRARGFIALAIGALAGCGEGGTRPGSPPATLVAVSMPVDTVVTGERTDPPVAVRVEDALGNPIEGTPVRFLVTAGEGRLFPGMAVSGRNGIAEAGFEANGAPGPATVRADIPSAPNVPALDFTIIAEAADSVLLFLREGDAQRAEVGSQLPIPFVIEARSASDRPAGGIPVVFEVSGDGRSAVLTADSLLTDADGLARTVLTLGREAGEYEVTARATGGVLSDTARVVATATATFDGAVILDSIAGGGLATGREAVLHGHGFSPIASENDVRIEGHPANVVSATGTELSIVVPDFGGACLPARDVGVRVLVEEDASNGVMSPLAPIVAPLDLEPGEVRTLRGAQAIGCVALVPGENRREYRLAVSSADRRRGEAAPVRLSVRSEMDAGDSRPPTTLSSRPVPAELAQRTRLGWRPDGALRRGALAELADRRTRPARLTPDIAPAMPPRVGDPIEVRFAVEPGLIASCDATGVPVSGMVRAVGRNLLLVEDADVPAGGLEPDDWETLLDELDGVVYPAVAAHFGAPADIDGNGRVIVLFTPRVNRLSTANAGQIGGFFLPLDLARSDRRPAAAESAGPACAASNEAEILYAAVADPEGSFGPVLPLGRALRGAKRVVAHELQHLISAESRVLGNDAGFAAAEEVWLDEALSGIAEEAAGLARIEAGTRENLMWGRLSSSSDEREAFASYLLPNFLDAGLYLADPGAVSVLADGAEGVAGARARGFGWLLLRWLGDRAGGDERVLFRSLVGGGRDADRGVRNIERATGRGWDDIVSDISAALLLEDSNLEGADERLGLLTWDLRGVLAGLSADPETRAGLDASFGLEPTTLEVETAAVAFDVGASTIRYFALAVGPDSPALALSLSTAAGTRVSESSEPQITIVRIR